MKKKILKLGDNIEDITVIGSLRKNLKILIPIKKSVSLYDWSHDISLKLSDFS